MLKLILALFAALLFVNSATPSHASNCDYVYVSDWANKQFLAENALYELIAKLPMIDHNPNWKYAMVEFADGRTIPFFIYASVNSSKVATRENQPFMLPEWFPKMQLASSIVSLHQEVAKDLSNMSANKKRNFLSLFFDKVATSMKQFMGFHYVSAKKLGEHTYTKSDDLAMTIKNAQVPVAIVDLSAVEPGSFLRENVESIFKKQGATNVKFLDQKTFDNELKKLTKDPPDTKFVKFQREIPIAQDRRDRSLIGIRFTKAALLSKEVKQSLQLLYQQNSRHDFAELLNNQDGTLLVSIKDNKGDYIPLGIATYVGVGKSLEQVYEYYSLNKTKDPDVHLLLELTGLTSPFLYSNSQGRRVDPQILRQIKADVINRHKQNNDKAIEDFKASFSQELKETDRITSQILTSELQQTLGSLTRLTDEVGN